MKQSEQNLQQFSALLNRLNRQASSLSAILTKEAETLTDGAPKELEKITASKQQIVQKLDLHYQQLDHFLKSCSLPYGKEGITRLLKQIPPSHQLHGDWLKLRALTKSCARQNEINGTSVRVMQQHAKRSLDILRGRHQSETFYGADGYTKRESYSTSILTV